MAPPLRLSYSALSTYQLCPRKYYWVYVRQIVPKGRQVALEFGGAWGLAMDAWHQGATADEAIGVFESAYPQPEGERLRTRQTARAMLQAYSIRWPRPEVFTLQASEQWIEEPIGPDLSWCGKLDKTILDAGLQRPMEHKTTASYLTMRTLERYQPSLQMIGYGWLGFKRGLDPNVLVDLAHVSPTTPKQGERFLRYDVRVEPWQMEEFVHTVQQVAKEIRARDATDPADWPPTWGACTSFGGCAYRSVCLTAPVARNRRIEEEYQLKPARPQQEDADV